MNVGKLIDQAAKTGPGLILGLVVGIGVAEWIDAGDPVNKLSSSGYQLILLIVTLAVTALWRIFRPMGKSAAAPPPSDPPGQPSDQTPPRDKP